MPVKCIDTRGDCMPRGDGTGPIGQGPKTGRAAGYCAGYNTPGFMNPVPHRVWGRGFWGGRYGGRGRGYRWWWRPAYPPLYPPVASYPDYPAPYPVEPKDEINYLEGVAETLRKELEDVQKRINELSESE